MYKSIVILIINIILITGCSKDNNEQPYFDNYNLSFSIWIPPFPKESMDIKSNKSFKIIYVSPLDTVDNFKAINDTVVGIISDSDMLKLIDYCKLADAYNVKFSDKLNDSINCDLIVDFVYTININNNKGQSNELSFTHCFIPKASYDLKNYSVSLMNKYFKNKK